MSAAGALAPPPLALALAALLSLYAGGAARLWRHAGVGRGLPVWRALAFAAGVLVLGAALAPPLVTAAAQLFWPHMLQHQLLLLLAAPLLALGAPQRALPWLLPRSSGAPRAGVRWPRRALALWARPAARLGAVGGALLAGGLHLALVWGWHAPALYGSALANPWLHRLEHAALLLAALLLWRAALGRRPALGAGLLFGAMVHAGLLGALLVFAGAPLYPPYAASAPLLGVEALRDQQLAGALMWAPGGLVYGAAAVAALAPLLRRGGAA